MDNFQDDFFGLLEWDTRFQEWNGWVDIAPHGEVGVQLPIEYTTSRELREHIHKRIEIIRRDELRFREKAATQLFLNGEYAFFVDENEPFDNEKFVREMGLGCVTFEADDPRTPLLLSYEYGEVGMEH